MTKPFFTSPENEDNLQRKTTSIYNKWNISATTYCIILKFKLKLRWPNHILWILELRWPNHILQILKVKTTSNYRRCKDDIKACSMWLMSSWEEIRGKLGGKLRGNIDCGSAQPSLFSNFSIITLTIFQNCLNLLMDLVGYIPDLHEYKKIYLVNFSVLFVKQDLEVVQLVYSSSGYCRY